MLDDTKRSNHNRKLKDGQCNTNKRKENTTQKLNDWSTRTPLKLM